MRGCSRLTLCQEVELLHQQGLILCPGKVKPLRGQQLGNSILLEVRIVRQLRYSVEASSLESWQAGGGWFLGTN